jgi:hypothetical protein
MLTFAMPIAPAEEALKHKAARQRFAGRGQRQSPGWMN